MPDFDRILFEGDFNPIDFNKGIDSMIESLRKAQAQGDVSSATLDKMQGAIDGVTVAATNLQAATGKPLAPSLSDGKLVNALGDIRSKAEETAITIEKLKVANIQLAQETKELTSEYSKNSKELIKLAAAQRSAINTTSDSFKLNETRIQALTQRNIQLTGAIADNRNVLTQSNTAIKNYTKSIATAAPEHNKLSAAVERLTSVQDIAAKGVTKLERIISFGLEAAVIGLALEIGGPLIKALLDWSESATAGGRASLQFQESIKENNDILEKSVGTFSDTTASFSKLTEDVDLAKRGFLDKNEVLKEYNTTMGLTTGQLKNFDDIEKKIIQDGPDYIKLLFLKAQATAAYALAGEAAKKALTAQATAEEDFGKIDFVATNKLNILKGAFGSSAGALASAGQNAVDQIAKNADKIAKAQQKAFDDLTKKGNDLEQQAAALANFRGFDFFGKKPDAAKKEKKEREDDFEKRKADFLEQISKLAASEFESELTIRKQYDDKLDKALADIGRDDTITSAEDAKLRTLARQLNSAELDKAIADFHKKVVDEQKKISDELAALNIQIATARVANIQDDFERERITIEAQSAATTEKLKQERDKQIKAIQDEALKVQFPSGFVDQKIAEINGAYASLLDQLEVTKNARLNKLAFDTFEKLAGNAKTLLDSKQFGVNQISLIDINKQTALFLAGKIDYTQFQEALTKIARDEAQKRFIIERDSLRAQINAQTQELQVNNDKLTDDEKDQLLKKIRDLESQLNALEKGNDLTTAGNVKSDRDKKLNDLIEYANAIQNVAQSVISFWQQANEAEQKALAYSIAIQDRRVAAAQQVAAKGNAEYLRMEEDRQNELLVQQADAARKTLAINAALQSSQLIVALISGIAQGAKVGGALGAIIEVGSIVAAIAGAFAIAQSLKPPPPTFFVGTEDTGGPGEVDNKGGKHAIIHPHERIITADQNKHLKGITNKQLIETINQHKVMVDTWKTPALPQLNYAAMDMATNVSATGNIRLASIMEESNRKMDENNALQRQTHRYLKNMGVSVNIDHRAFAITVLQAADVITKNKKL